MDKALFRRLRRGSKVRHGLWGPVEVLAKPEGDSVLVRITSPSGAGFLNLAANRTDLHPYKDRGLRK